MEDELAQQIRDLEPSLADPAFLEKLAAQSKRPSSETVPRNTWFRAMAQITIDQDLTEWGQLLTRVATHVPFLLPLLQDIEKELNRVLNALAPAEPTERQRAFLQEEWETLIGAEEFIEMTGDIVREVTSASNQLLDQFLLPAIKDFVDDDASMETFERIMRAEWFNFLDRHEAESVIKPVDETEMQIPISLVGFHKTIKREEPDATTFRLRGEGTLAVNIAEQEVDPRERRARRCENCARWIRSIWTYMGTGVLDIVRGGLNLVRTEPVFVTLSLIHVGALMIYLIRPAELLGELQGEVQTMGDILMHPRLIVDTLNKTMATIVKETLPEVRAGFMESLSNSVFQALSNAPGLPYPRAFEMAALFPGMMSFANMMQASNDAFLRHLGYDSRFQQEAMIATDKFLHQFVRSGGYVGLNITDPSVTLENFHTFRPVIYKENEVILDEFDAAIRALIKMLNNLRPLAERSLETANVTWDVPAVPLRLLFETVPLRGSDVLAMMNNPRYQLLGAYVEFRRDPTLPDPLQFVRTGTSIWEADMMTSDVVLSFLRQLGGYAGFAMPVLIRGVSDIFRLRTYSAGTVGWSLASVAAGAAAPLVTDRPYVWGALLTVQWGPVMMRLVQAWWQLRYRDKEALVQTVNSLVLAARLVPQLISAPSPYLEMGRLSSFLDWFQWGGVRLLLYSRGSGTLVSLSVVEALLRPTRDTAPLPPLIAAMTLHFLVLRLREGADTVQYRRLVNAVIDRVLPGTWNQAFRRRINAIENTIHTSDYHRWDTPEYNTPNMPRANEQGHFSISLRMALALASIVWETAGYMHTGLAIVDLARDITHRLSNADDFRLDLL